MAEPPPLIVVIAGYNAAGTVARAVRSAIGQDGIAGVIVIDDGSTDGTASAAAAAGATVISQANAGPGAARNLGLDEAARRRAHAIILDADDELRPGAMGGILGALARVPDAAGVVGAHEQTGAGLHEGPRLRRPEPDWLQCGHVEPPTAVLGTHHVFCTTGLTLTRRAIEAGIRFDPALRFAEDRDIIYRAGAVGPIAVTDAVLVTKHDSPAQLTTSPAQSRRWLADQVRLTEKHAPLNGQPPPAELGPALAWVLKNTCRVLARAGERLPADEWRAACAALRERGWRIPVGARKWYAAGILRSRISPRRESVPH
jgi:hypothetical protein